MYLDVEGRDCYAQDAAYVLVDLTTDFQPGGGVLYPYVLSYTGECLYAISKKHPGCYAVYVDLSRLGALTPRATAIVGGALSGNLRAGLSPENHVDFYETVPEVEDLPYPTDKIIGTISGYPTTQITLDHHLFIRQRELSAMLSCLADNEAYDRLAAITRMLKRADVLGVDNKISATTFAVYFMVAPMFAVKFLAWIMRVAGSKEQLNSLLKSESQAAKQSQTVFRNDLSCVYELNTLFNRLDGDVDWDTERKHRMEPNTVAISSATVYQLATQIFRDAINEGQKPYKMKWSAYWQTRWSTLPGGSVISQYDEDVELKKKLPTDAKVKSAWFAANHNADINYWLKRQPSIFASTSTKYEWGKVRALYGADVTSFLHADFGMHMCEDTLPSYFPVGKRANERYINSVIEKFSTGVPFCFDYDDFNSQHSNSSMAAVVMAWRDAYASKLSSEQLQSVNWTIDSISSVKVRFNDVREVFNISGTLLSGWRLTSFINTVLNRVYLVWAGLDKKSIYSLHNGDDMYASTVTVQDALDTIRNAKQLGIRAQVSKTNIGTIGEFLRVDTRAKDTTGRQYLARAIATCVHGRVETGAPHDLRALLLAFKTRAEAVEHRGGNAKLARALLSAQEEFASELFAVQPGVLNGLKHYHPIQGGMNEKGTPETCRVVQKTMDDIQGFELAFEPIRQGVYEYAEYVRRKLNIPREKVEYNKIYRSAVKSLLRSRISYEIVIDEDPLLLPYFGQWKAHSKSYWISSIAKARSLGFVAARQLIGVNGALAAKIRNARDPIRYMGVIL